MMKCKASLVLIPGGLSSGGRYANLSFANCPICRGFVDFHIEHREHH